MHAVDDLADVADAGAAGGVHLHHVHMAPLGDGAAGLAFAAGLYRGAALAVGADAVQPLGDDARGGGLAHATHAGHDEGMCDPVGLKGVFQGAHHGILTDQVGKGLRAVFQRQNLIVSLIGSCVAHLTPVRFSATHS